MAYYKQIYCPFPKGFYWIPPTQQEVVYDSQTNVTTMPVTVGYENEQSIYPVYYLGDCSSFYMDVILTDPVLEGSTEHVGDIPAGIPDLAQ